MTKVLQKEQRRNPSSNLAKMMDKILTKYIFLKNNFFSFIKKFREFLVKFVPAFVGYFGVFYMAIQDPGEIALDGLKESREKIHQELTQLGANIMHKRKEGKHNQIMHQNKTKRTIEQ